MATAQGRRRGPSHKNPEGIPPDHRNPGQTANKSASADFFTVMRRRFRTSADAWAAYRREALADFRFCDLQQQWNPEDEQRRNASKRPCLTIDQVRQFKKQIVNAQRQSRMGGTVHPVGDGADPDTAETYQGILRLIQKPLNYAPAETWYDLAFDHMVTGGMGVLRWFTEFVPGTFRQRIRVFGVENPLAVYLDPSFREPDASDMRYAFITEDFGRDEYESRWPKSRMASGEDFKSLGDDRPFWMPEGSIRVAEYFYVEIEPIELALIPDETSATRTRVIEAAQLPKGAAVLDRRIEERRVVKWARVNGMEVLEGNDDLTAGQVFIGDEIPIIPVFGDMLQIEGKRHVSGMIRYMRDPQRMANFFASALAEAIALAPKSPFIAEVTTIEAFKDLWGRANIDNLSVLPYNATAGPNGEPNGPPQRQTAEPPIQAMVEGYQLMLVALQATANMYEPSLGKNKSDQSGKAISLLQKQGDQGTSNWSDNLARSMVTLFRQLVRAIPHVYDVPQVLHILRNDDQPASVLVHAGQPPAPLEPGHQPTPTQDLNSLAPAFQAAEKIYDLDNGEYAVEVSIGNNATTRRMEFIAVASQLYETDPQFMQASLDIFLNHLDGPGFHSLAERAKLMLPPQIQQTLNNGQLDANALQAKQQQLMQMVDLLTKELKAKTDIINTEEIKRAGDLQRVQLEADTKIRVASIQAEGGIIQAEIKAKLASQQAELDLLHTQLEGLNAAGEQGRDHAQELLAAEQANAHALQQGQAGAVQDANQSAQDHQQTLEQGQQAAALAPPSAAAGEGASA